jgi:hypothetical protein
MLGNFRCLPLSLFSITVTKYEVIDRNYSSAPRIRKVIAMTPNHRTIASLAFAAACLATIAATPNARAQTEPSRAELITNGPQINPGDRSGARTAEQNVRDSHNYDAMVHANPNYRAVRQHKECGPIDDAKLHADCLATFK